MKSSVLFSTLAAALLFSFSYMDVAFARDWYVSIQRGKGKKGTIEKPAKELGNIISKLSAGDVVRIAGGVYMGRGDSGSHVITVPVSIIGGYSDDFKKTRSLGQVPDNLQWSKSIPELQNDTCTIY